MSMKKKIGLAVGAVVVAALLVVGYFAFLAPKAQEGSKEVKIEVIIESAKIDKDFTYKTDAAFMKDLLEEKKDELQAVTETGSYGLFLTGLMGVEADETKEYYNIKIDGVDATVGISELPVENGKTYTFTLMGF